jgi:hypothetical protein
MATTSETNLESIPVSPELLNAATRWYSYSWWGLIGFGSTAALAAIGTVVFTLIQFWSGGVLDRHTEWRTAVLERETAKANESAALATQRTEELRRANLALEAQIAPRRITNEQRSALVQSLRKFSGRKVLVSSYSLDAEGMLLGQTIIKILQEADVAVTGLTTIVPITTLRAGIHVTAVAEAARALAHGIAEGIAQNTSLTVTYNPAIPADEAQIELGGSGDVAKFEALVLVALKPPPK